MRAEDRPGEPARRRELLDREDVREHAHPHAALVGRRDASGVTQVTTASVRFTDIGVPNTIEVPPNARDVSVDELANPGPPPG